MVVTGGGNARRRREESGLYARWQRRQLHRSVRQLPSVSDCAAHGDRYNRNVCVFQWKRCKAYYPPAWKRALRLLASGVGEAGEEVFSGFVDPALEAILDGTTGYNRDTISEVAHSALVGGILGLLGGGVQTVKNAASAGTDLDTSAQSAAVQSKTAAPEGTAEEAGNREHQTSEANRESDFRAYTGLTDDEKRSIREFNKKYYARTTFDLLPEYSSAIIPDTKIVHYALDPNHTRGKDKAIVFERVLGYNQNNSSELIAQVRSGLNRYLAKERDATQYGRVFTVRMLIRGANGRIAPIVTGWQIDTGKTTPKLTSIYVVHWEA